MSSTKVAAAIDVRFLYLVYLTAAGIVFSFFFFPTFAFAGSTVVLPSEVSADATSALTATSTTTSASVESQVKAFFKDAPAMVAIARCESGLRQFGSGGEVLRGGAGGGMVGVFQIYESIHQRAARALGFDLEELAGNMGYAKHLYEAEGTTPWNSGMSCWKNAPEVTQAKVATHTDTKASVKKPNTKRELEAKIRMLKKLLAQLQELLAEQKRLTAR